MKNVLFGCHGNQIQENSEFFITWLPSKPQLSLLMPKNIVLSMPSHFRPSKTNKMHLFCKKCYYIMFLAISPNNDDLNGAKLSQNIFHFESTANFFSKLVNSQNYFTFLLSVYPMMHIEKTTHLS